MMCKKYLFIILVMCQMVGKAQNANVAMFNASDANTYYLSTQTNYSIPFNLTDMGPQFASLVKYSYSINNGTPIKQTATVDHNRSVNCVNAVGLTKYRIAFTTPVNFATAGTYTIKIWIDSINGFSDMVHSNDTLVRKYKALPNLSNRKGLTEYFYHVSCGPCGEDGTPYYEHLLANYDDYTVGVKLHNYAGVGAWSAMNCPESDIIENTIGIFSHPEFAYNRKSLAPYDNSNNYYPDAAHCPLDSNFLTKDVVFYNKVPTELSVSNFTSNNVNNTISFLANAKFLDAMTFSKETRMSCMLVEDSIYYYQFDNNLPAVDSIYHRYVVRKIYGGAMGGVATVPAMVSANQVVSLNVTDTLPTTYNKSRLYLIPIVQYFSTATDGYEILNVKRFKMNSIALPNEVINFAKSNYKMYPNPSSTCLTIESDEDLIAAIKIISMDGKVSLRKAYLNEKQIKVDVHSLQNGMYFVELMDSKGQIHFSKVLIEKE